MRVDLSGRDPFPSAVHHFSFTSSRRLQSRLNINNSIILDQNIGFDHVWLRVAVLEGEDKTILEKDVWHDDQLSARVSKAKASIACATTDAVYIVSMRLPESHPNK